MKNDYPIATGELDRQRLAIINNLYNHSIQQFILHQGLKAGMKVLEIGCGTGQMACWLAQQVTNKGKIIAIDINADQLAIAEQAAKKAGITNIDFQQLDIKEIHNLKDKFDFIYGAAVVEFIAGDRKDIFKQLYKLLNPSGILTYETISAIENGHFSYPHQPIIDDYFEINKNYFLTSQLAADLPSELYSWFKQFGLKDITLKANQPILSNNIEKSILRLGAINTRDTVFKKLSGTEFERVINELQIIEDDPEIIVGFFRGLLISGMRRI